MSGNQLASSGGETTSGLLESLTLTEQQWLTEQHQSAKEAWSRFGAFSLPGVEHFADRLITAPAIKRQLEQAAPELTGTLGLLFVPEFLSIPVLPELRRHQGFRTDSFSPHISLDSHRYGDWAVCLAQISQKAGLNQVDNEHSNFMKLISHSLRNLNGIYCRGLSYQEWAALSLQSTDHLGPSLLGEEVTIENQWYSGAGRNRYPSNKTWDRYPIAAVFDNRENRYELAPEYSGRTPFRPSVRLLRPH